MLKLSKWVIYNKIRQCLIGIPSDFLLLRACEINNAVNDAVNWMWDFRANETTWKSVIVIGNQWEGWKVC